MPPNGTAEEQKRILEDALAKGVQGIALSPKDPENMTALLDQELILTTQQRDTLHTTLSTKWKEEWEHWLLVANQEEENFPSFADKIVSRIITPAQKQIWKSIPKLDLAELQFEEVFLEIADIPENDKIIEENNDYWMNQKS